jgi:hypothetical protein
MKTEGKDREGGMSSQCDTSSQSNTTSQTNTLSGLEKKIGAVEREHVNIGVVEKDLTRWLELKKKKRKRSA